MDVEVDGEWMMGSEVIDWESEFCMTGLTLSKNMHQKDIAIPPKMNNNKKSISIIAEVNRSRL